MMTDMAQDASPTDDEALRSTMAMLSVLGYPAMAERIRTLAAEVRAGRERIEWLEATSHDALKYKDEQLIAAEQRAERAKVALKDATNRVGALQAWLATVWASQ